MILLRGLFAFREKKNKLSWLEMLKVRNDPGLTFNEPCSVDAHVEQVLLANLVLVVAQSRPQQPRLLMGMQQSI